MLISFHVGTLMKTCSVFLIEILIELIVDSYTVVTYRDSVNPLSSLPSVNIWKTDNNNIVSRIFSLI